LPFSLKLSRAISHAKHVYLSGLYFDSQTPKGTFAYYGGNEVKYNTINVLGKKTSVNRTSKFVKSQMPRIYGDAGKHKYSVSYLASNGNWYSSKWFDDADEFLQPDFSNYDIDEDDITIESIIIKHVKVGTSGGAGDHNDCLYVVVKFALGKTNTKAFLRDDILGIVDDPSLFKTCSGTPNEN